MPQNRKIMILGRLRAKPLLTWQLLCALLCIGLIAWQAEGEAAAAIIRSILFGNLAVTALIGASVAGVVHFHRLWRRRDRHIVHDGSRLYAGSASWPLVLIRDVIIAQNELGIASLRLVVDDDSEVTRELVKLYLLEDRPEVVRDAVLFAAAGTRGVPAGAIVN